MVSWAPFFCFQISTHKDAQSDRTLSFGRGPDALVGGAQTPRGRGPAA